MYTCEKIYRENNLTSSNKYDLSSIWSLTEKNVDAFKYYLRDYLIKNFNLLTPISNLSLSRVNNNFYI